MFKYIFLFSVYLTLPRQVLSQKTDTTIMYLKFVPTSRKPVLPDSADYVRIITPPDPGEKLVNVKEYYRNGKLKAVGKYEWDDEAPGREVRNGNFLTYYPDGKRQSIIHYTHNIADGDEFSYFLNGTLYCYTQNVLKTGERAKKLYLDCYDTKGNKICENGNGTWILYDVAQNPLLQGEVKNGLFEGDWTGATTDKVPIKYTLKYDRGAYVSGIGYDPNGAAYPFYKEIEPASFDGNGGFILFVQLLRGKIKLPKDADGKKLPLDMKLDTAHISFIVEKDGHLTNGQIIGNTRSELTEALNIALGKITGWTPRKYYGVPLRTRLIFPYQEIGRVEGNMYHREIQYREYIVGY